jgi:hypothetical protein
MPLDSKLTEEQLFYSLIASLEHSVWVSLGKVKNPANDKIERNLYAASMNIDMIDMLYKRMQGNLNEQEDGYIGRILSELKMNFVDEKKKVDDLPEDKSEEPKVKAKTEEKSGIKQSKAKKTTAKPKDKK